MKLMGPNPAATLKPERVSSVPSMDDNIRCQNRSFLKMTCQYTHIYIHQRVGRREMGRETKREKECHKERPKESKIGKCG